MKTRTASFPAPGKLNLMLRVVGRRADGFHLLQTVLRLIDYGDTLHFRVRDEPEIARVNEVDGVPVANDLAVRAALLLQRATGTRRPGPASCSSTAVSCVDSSGHSSKRD